MGGIAVRRSIRSSYTHTIYASYLGCVTQAAVNNFAPLLFLTFTSGYGLTLDQITLLTTVNFAVQLLVDLLSAGFIDRIGYRAGILAAHLLAGCGLAGLALLPELLGDAWIGLLLAVVLYAIGGGLIEVLISPIVEACPTEEKAAAMSLLHSFYCWGHMAVVLLSTAFFAAFGIENWRVLACLWAAVPFLNAVYFSRVPLYPVSPQHERVPISALLRHRAFWLLALLMICAGASEQAMSQWSSAFAELALGVSKAAGDLAGPCAFALCMGTARVLYSKFSSRIPLRTAIAGCAALCIGCYALAVFAGGSPMLGLLGCAVCGFSVGIFWPGTFSMAARMLPGGGTAMYALMALAGDLGCTCGPTAVGFAAATAGGRLQAGLFAAMAFPLIMLLGIARIPPVQAEDAGQPPLPLSKP